MMCVANHIESVFRSHGMASFVNGNEFPFTKITKSQFDLVDDEY